MTAYIIERLYPTGWRRTGELFWTETTAIAQAKALVKRGFILSTRVLQVTVHSDVVFEVSEDAKSSRKRGEPCPQ